jgi:hypothetical protein
VKGVYGLTGSAEDAKEAVIEVEGSLNLSGSTIEVVPERQLSKPKGRKGSATR